MPTRHTTLVLDDRALREVPGRAYGTPKEIWGFRLPATTGPAFRVARVARAALAANAVRLGLEAIDLAHRRTITSVGASHVIFSQEHFGIYVHRAYVTVHMDTRGSVYLLKNRAVPVEHLPPRQKAELSAGRARTIARAAIRRKGVVMQVRAPHLVWYPVRTRLHLSYKVRLTRRVPAEDWIVFVDARTGKIWSKYDNLATRARATVFDPNPVVTLDDWSSLLTPRRNPKRPPPAVYRRVGLKGLDGSGTLSGRRVTTSPTRRRLRRVSGDFSCASHEHGFEEVMAYFHLDAAIRYVEGLGYTGKKRIFTEPLPVNARVNAEDNSFYSPSSRSLGFGTGGVDDAEDGETILHEFGHALQDAICPDFGQSAEAAAMGEGFGDYLAASFFAARKRGAPRLLAAVMTWDNLESSEDDDEPPALRRLDGRLTYESFDHAADADEHDNGEIWSAVLWDIWKAIGRQAADRIIIESHFQLDGFTSFAKAARAILDADRHLYRGRHARTLSRIFRRRGIGPIE
jgi:hypothetical protein